MWIRHYNQGKIHKLIDYFCLIVQNSLCNAKCANSSEIECSFRFRKKIVMKTKWTHTEATCELWLQSKSKWDRIGAEMSWAIGIRAEKRKSENSRNVAVALIRSEIRRKAECLHGKVNGRKGTQRTRKRQRHTTQQGLATVAQSTHNATVFL